MLKNAKDMRKLTSRNATLIEELNNFMDDIITTSANLGRYAVQMNICRDYNSYINESVIRSLNILGYIITDIKLDPDTSQYLSYIVSWGL